MGERDKLRQARLPEDLEKDPSPQEQENQPTIEDMDPGDVVYTWPESLVVTQDRKLWLVPEDVVHFVPSPSNTMIVIRTEEGYEVDIRGIPEEQALWEGHDRDEHFVEAMSLLPVIKVYRH